ncbi:hypothetical protein [Caldivirga maquilingensis]|uniref:Uncharacterized protein n=1 Tax=Caldivirga maquilingensis (strain ATCC 700844 / DSM 13496 / JCM 10307 / IC-167) TaxID=397948 RepID=A8M9G8_CALMQ|nr:hypothetical protein [Caldivirga maquilingensis]ABW02387.1 hypothetical protein Cmaq_1564 [Caldivirga maquilingensis IC-167]
MAEKFDKYYDYFSSMHGGIRIRPRSINLGLLRINLGGGSLVELRTGGRGMASRINATGVMEGEHVELVNPPEDVRVIRGSFVKVQNGDLEAVEGEEVVLYNVNVSRVTGRRVKIMNSDVNHIEAEDATLINTDAGEVIVSRGEFINCDIDTLEYRESYKVVNTDVKNLRKA